MKVELDLFPKIIDGEGRTVSLPKGWVSGQGWKVDPSLLLHLDRGQSDPEDEDEQKAAVLLIKMWKQEITSNIEIQSFAESFVSDGALLNPKRWEKFKSYHINIAVQNIAKDCDRKEAKEKYQKGIDEMNKARKDKYRASFFSRQRVGFLMEKTLKHLVEQYTMSEDGPRSHDAFLDDTEDKDSRDFIVRELTELLEKFRELF